MFLDQFAVSILQCFINALNMLLFKINNLDLNKGRPRINAALESREFNKRRGVQSIKYGIYNCRHYFKKVPAIYYQTDIYLRLDIHSTHIKKYALYYVFTRQWKLEKYGVSFCTRTC